MNWKEFENNLKKQVDGHPTPIDPNAFWDRLQHKKKERKAFWMWFPATLFLAVAATLFILKSLEERPIETNQDLVRPSEIIAGANKIKSKSITNSKSDTISYQNEATEQSIEKNKWQPKILEKLSVNPKIIPDFNKSTIDHKLKKNYHNPRKNKLNSNRTLFTNEKENLAENTNKNNILTFEKSHESTNLLVDQSTIESQNTLKKNAAQDDKILLQLSLLPILPYSVLINDNIEENVFLQSLRRDINPNQKPKTKNNSISIFAGYGSYSRTLTASDSLSILKINNRTETETMLDFYQAGLRYSFTKGIMKHFTAGIQYTQYISRFNWERSWNTKDTIDHPVQNFYSNGKIDTSFVAGIYTTNYHRRVENFNYFKTLQIPIYYAPWFLNFNKIHLKPSVGLVTSIWQSESGLIKKDAIEFQNLYTESIIRNGIQLSGEIMLNCELNLSDNSLVFIDIFYNRDLTNTLREGYLIKQNIQSYGLRLGWGMKF